MKKNVIKGIIFIIVLVVAFMSFNAFFYTNLKFKQIGKIEYNISSYIIDNNKIVFSSIDENNINIYKIDPSDVTPSLYVSIPYTNNITSQELLSVNDSYYYVYNNNIVKINKNNKEIKTYTKDNNLLVINDYDNALYTLNNNTLTSIINESTLTINSLISNIKTIQFYNQYSAVINTYNNSIYDYNFYNNEYKLIASKVKDFYINNYQLYYLYTTDKLVINNYDLYTNTLDYFTLDNIIYNYLKVVDDYMYLFNDNKIYTISLSRKKKHDTLKMGKYEASLSYDLNDVLIDNVDLMYLIVRKENIDYNTSSYYYETYLYRYKH